MFQVELEFQARSNFLKNVTSVARVEFEVELDSLGVKY